MITPRTLVAALLAGLLALVLFTVLLVACEAVNASSGDGGCDNTWGLTGAAVKPVPPPAPRPAGPKAPDLKKPPARQPVAPEAPARKPVRTGAPLADVDLGGC